jgi:V/A-type H+/Na+-transporting ATPase subunit A
MEVVGEEGVAMNEIVTYLKGELYDVVYLQQNAFDKEDSFCSQERQIELFTLLQKIFCTQFVFNDHDEARSSFLSLQNQIKNMNYLAYSSEEYKNTLEKVCQTTDQMGSRT